MTLTNTSLIGDGTDTLVSIERAHLIGGSSGNTLDASAFAMGAVHLEGHDGDDVLLGGSFGDTLEPGDGVAFDTAEGNDGDDTYVFIDGTGDITINELAGTDTLDFSHLLSPLTLDLSGVVITGGFSRAISGSAAGFEIIIGTDFDDTLTGNAATDNTFYPGLGGDTLDGQGGANTYIFAATSGFETEKVIGAPSPGTDLLDFSAINLNTNVDFNGGVVTHTDRRVTVSDVDYAHTGSGDDIFTNNTHANSFVSSTGDDTFIIYDHGSSVKITDDGGIETLDFRNTDGVTLDLISGAATIASLTHGQTVDGLNTDFEIIYGSPFADTIDGNDLANTIYPGDGLDTINGQGGDDIYIITSLEAVTIDDASGADTLDFSAVTGPLTFNLAGSILADNGFNSIATSATDAFESIIATAQDDHYIFADTGTHSITDSGGTDTFDFSALTSAITADLRGTSTAITLTVSIDPGTEIENLIGSDHADSLTGNDLANHLQGGLGDDSLFGLKGADTLLAESDAATNTLDGGSGDDLYPFESGTIITTTTTILIEDSGRVAGGLAAGGGTDTLDLSALGSVSIDLSSILLQSITHHHDINLQDSAGVSSDYFENLIGSVSAPNAITGNAADNHFTGGDADDTYIILPGFGADTISESIISAFDSIDMSAMSAIGDPIDLLIGSGNLLFTVGTDTLSAPDRIENILLGAGDDYFHFTALGSTSAAIDGNGGVNTYDGDPADTGGVTNF
jgi:Ca2+-binding RTX toxin-like protein